MDAFNLGAQLLEKLLNVLDKLLPILFKEICLVWTVKCDLEKLKLTLSTINVVLLDAEEKKTHNHELREWLSQVKNAYYDA